MNFLKIILTTIAVLVIILLFTPIIWMKIGPAGYLEYGPDVPDVFIYGGFIFGKDLNWGPINFAWKFQLFFMLFYLFLTIKAFVHLTKKKSILVLSILNAILLLLFSWWILAYIGGVVTNSDGADLTVYWVSGYHIYLVIVVLNIIQLIGAIGLVMKKARLLSIRTKWN